jgi:hypothetical protein
MGAKQSRTDQKPLHRLAPTRDLKKSGLHPIGDIAAPEGVLSVGHPSVWMLPPIGLNKPCTRPQKTTMLFNKSKYTPSGQSIYTHPADQRPVTVFQGVNIAVPRGTHKVSLLVSNKRPIALVVKISGSGRPATRQSLGGVEALNYFLSFCNPCRLQKQSTTQDEIEYMLAYGAYDQWETSQVQGAFDFPDIVVEPERLGIGIGFTHNDVAPVHLCYDSQGTVSHVVLGIEPTDDISFAIEYYDPGNEDKDPKALPIPALSKRPSPPYHAKDWPGCVCVGNDGLWYMSRQNANGVFAWKPAF